jgi:transposase
MPVLSRYALTNEQWTQIEDKLPGRVGSVGVTAKDNRLFVDAVALCATAVVYKFRAGIPWRDLPARFGSWHAIYVRFNRWSKKGVWQRLFEQLSKALDNEYAMIDATIVRGYAGVSARIAMPVVNVKRGDGQGITPEQSQHCQALGRSRGGLSCKVHAPCDARGRPTKLVLTPGQASDLQGADVLVPQVTSGTLIGDKGYDADKRVRAVLAAQGKRAVIPPRRGRTSPAPFGQEDKELYKHTNSGTGSRTSSAGSRTGAASPPATRRQHVTSCPASTWLPLSSGSTQQTLIDNIA